jgi:hypothetical protein
MCGRFRVPSVHPDNRLPGEPEARAEAVGVKGSRREARTFETSARGPSGPYRTLAHCTLTTADVCGSSD